MPMKQEVLLTIFALWLLLGAPSKQIFALGENPSAAQDSVPTATPETAVHMSERINNYRTERGLPAYYLDHSLSQASQWVVDTMAATEFISHYDESGANPQQRAKKAGYDQHVTEIIYGGFGGAEAAWEWWHENELHHDLIISKDYVELGIATAVSEQSGRQYWAVMFGVGDGQYETETSTNTHDESEAATKRPPTVSTSEVTAVPPVSTAILSTPTAITEPAALAVDSTPTNPTPSTQNQPTVIQKTETAPQNSMQETKWLIIAAIATIVLGIAVFYFPKLGLSQKFKERA
ncbi:MAG: hypothetical protein CSB13_00190 [Chloroflexi bacterium]|nr:MAG: hypothetical protein CSB13_00190 [Chloroflexota bacterium]